MQLPVAHKKNMDYTGAQLKVIWRMFGSFKYLRTNLVVLYFNHVLLHQLVTNLSLIQYYSIVGWPGDEEGNDFRLRADVNNIPGSKAEEDDNIVNNIAGSMSSLDGPLLSAHNKRRYN
jgi:hypothetical protein